MLRILGNKSTACDGLNRREAMQVGGLSLFSGLTLPNLLSADDRGLGRAKSVILVNLFGGPPHMDMFDLKPNAPEETRGEMKSTSTSVPGLQICDLMPQIATITERMIHGSQASRISRCEAVRMPICTGGVPGTPAPSGDGRGVASARDGSWPRRAGEVQISRGCQTFRNSTRASMEVIEAPISTIHGLT